ncbi:jg2949, partial [Pararge aegeria aegeria]
PSGECPRTVAPSLQLAPLPAARLGSTQRLMRVAGPDYLTCSEAGNSSILAIHLPPLNRRTEATPAC